MREYLTAHLKAACGFPVSFGKFGPGAATPRAACYRIGLRSNWTLDGRGVSQTRVQIDVYGKTAGEVMAAENAIRDALDGYQGGPIQGAFLDSVRDGDDIDIGPLARTSLTFLVSHQD